MRQRAAGRQITGRRLALSNATLRDRGTKRGFLAGPAMAQRLSRPGGSLGGHWGVVSATVVWPLALLPLIASALRKASPGISIAELISHDIAL